VKEAARGGVEDATLAVGVKMLVLALDLALDEAVRQKEASNGTFLAGKHK